MGTDRERKTNKQTKNIQIKIKMLEIETRHSSDKASYFPRPQYTPHGSEASGWLRAAIGKAARDEAVVNGHAVEAIQ